MSITKKILLLKRTLYNNKEMSIYVDDIIDFIEHLMKCTPGEVKVYSDDYEPDGGWVQWEEKYLSFFSEDHQEHPRTYLH